MPGLDGGHGGAGGVASVSVFGAQHEESGDEPSDQGHGGANLRDEMPEEALEIASSVRPKALRIRVAPGAEDEPVEADEDTDAEEIARSRAAAVESRYAGRYSIEETLTSTPHLQRHLAVQEPLVRRVVLTVLPQNRPGEVQQALESRFLRDARVLARLRHPALAPVHDAGRAPDGTCFVTEEVPYGPTIQQLSSSGALRAEPLLQIFKAVVGAIGAMHEAGVVHRCLRGDCVVIGSVIGEGPAPVQVGRYGWHVLPEDGPVEDDPAAVVVWPPELLSGEEPDESGDVYAIGVLLYHALAGVPAYTGTGSEIRAARAAGPPPPLPHPGGMLSALATLAEQCMDPSPEARPASARAILTRLEEIGRPPAPPPPAPVKAGWSTRLAAAAITGAALPTVLLIAGGVWFTTRPPEPIAPDAPLAAPAVPAPAVPDEAATEALVNERVAAWLKEHGVGLPGSEAPPPEPAVTTPPAPVAQPAAPRPPPPREATPVARSLPEPAPVVPVEVVPVMVEPVAVVEPVVVVPAVVEPAPPVATVAPAAPVVQGAAALSGLWLGKVSGGTIAFDLVVSESGVVQGRARRSDYAGEGRITGRVQASAEGLRVSISVSQDGTTSTYTGSIVDGAFVGKVFDGAKGIGRFSVRR